MKVLHAHSGNMWGGVESVLLTLARYREVAPAMPMEVALCFDGRLRRELESAGVPVHMLGGVRLGRPWTAWRARRRLVALVRGGGFDVVLCHNPWALAALGPAARRSGARLVVWLHGPPDRAQWLDRTAARRRPELVIANSDFTAKAAQRVFASEPCEVCCPPVPPPAPGEALRLRAPDAPEGTRVLLMASRFEPLKGHEVLLAALATLKDRADWTCWLAGAPQGAGEDAYARRVQRRRDALGLADRVRFLGFRPDVPALLRRSFLLCQPNLRPEAFGVTFIEAMDRGVPVVTSRLGGAPEVVDETCGILVPPGDAAVLARALSELLDDPTRAARLGAAGPARARALCDPPRQIGRLEQLLRGNPASPTP
jgi:glycosyltransferase involved in cell wall biosynthesis